MEEGIWRLLGLVGWGVAVAISAAYKSREAEEKEERRRRDISNGVYLPIHAVGDGDGEYGDDSDGGNFGGGE